MMFKALWSASCACGRPRQWARHFYLVSTSWQQSGGDAGAGETGNQLLQDDSSGQHRLQECNSKPVFQQCPAQDSSSTADTPLDKLDALLVQLKADKQTIIFAKQHLIASKHMYRDVMRSFSDHVISQVNLVANTKLTRTVQTILDGNADKSTLLPHFLSHARSVEPLVGPVEHLLKTSKLTSPPSWFPEARARPRKIIFHAGPTNSGKTHSALQSFKAATTAIYCAPLRLLAHEVFHQANSEGAGCDLLTGEEVQFCSGDPSRPASRLSCTVEMAFSGRYSPYDVAVIDEIQMIADSERGGAWTRALLGIAATEVHLCGHQCAIGLVEKIVASAGDEMEVCHYERLSPLVLSKKTLQGCYDGIKPGDCVVVFSRSKVFEISRFIEKATGQNCAVIYGDLPPGVRVKQAEIFNDLTSECDVMVATDAIGMGLNLNIGRIIFDSLKKFDGKRLRDLTPAHAAQVSGRAGRYGKKHSRGLVTTFQQKDFKQLQKLLKSDIKDTKKAGLYPSVEQIKHFASFIPKAKLYEILTLFVKMAELDGKYFLCDLSRQIDLAYELKEMDMSLEDMFQFTLAPVDEEKKEVVAAFVEFAEHFSKGWEVSEEILFNHLGHPPTVAKTSSKLAELELKYEVVKLYLWLGMRYPDVFVAVEEVHTLEDAIEECIEDSLEQGPSSARQARSGHKARDRARARARARARRTYSGRSRKRKKQVVFS